MLPGREPPIVGPTRKEEGVVGRSLLGGVVVVAAVALAFVMVALTMALNS
jgi:hypothetical protein